MKRACVGVILLLSLLAAAPAPSPKLIRLPIRGYAFANRGDDSAVAALDPTADLVMLFPRLMNGSTDGAVQRRVGRLPISLVHKRVDDKGYFLVGCLGDETLWVLDDATLNVVKTLRLAAAPSTVVAPRDASVPFAYYVGGKNYEEISPRQIDLRAMRETARVRTGEQHREISISADGRYLYARSSGISPSGFRCFEIVPPAPGSETIIAAPVVSEHRDSETYMPDMTSTYTAVGAKLYSADLRHEVTALSAAPLIFMPDRPFALALNGASLVAFSMNTFKEVASVALPIPPQRERGPGDPPPGFVIEQRLELAGLAAPYRPAILADSRGKTLLVAQGERVVVMPVGALRLPDEPYLFANVSGSTRVAPGDSVALKVAPRDPRVKLELSSGPDGMQFENGQLLWTPLPSDIGSPRAVLRLSFGDIERLQDVVFDVARASASLSFLPGACILSADSASVLVAGFQVPDPNAPRSDRPPRVHLAVVDLKEKRLLAQRALDDQIIVENDRLAIDSSHVYGIVQGADTILVLSRKDLSDARRLFTTGRPTKVFAVDNARLVVQTAETGPQSFSVPQLQPLQPPAPLPDARYVAQDNEPALLRMCDGWFESGVLWDAQLDRPRLLVAPVGFVDVFLGLRGSFREDRLPASALASPWGTIVAGNQLMRTSAQKVGAINQPAIVLRSVPAAAELARQNVQGTPPRIRLELALHDLVAGRKLADIVLSEEPVRYLPGGGEGQPRAELLETPDGTLVAQVADRVFIVAADEIKRRASAFPIPLHFLPQQDVFVIDPGKPMTIKQQIRGGRGAIEFASAVAADDPRRVGITVSRETGAISIGIGALDDPIAQALDNTFRQNRGGVNVSEIERYRVRMAPIFERITGKVPQGVPMTLTIGAIARDADQQTARIEYTLMLDVDPGVPLAPLAPTLPPRRNAPAAAAPATATSQPPASSAAGEDVTALRKRIKDLEEQNARLQGQRQSQGQDSPRR